MPPNFLPPPSVNYQIVPIRHSVNLNRVTPIRSLQNLNSFNNHQEKLLRNSEERRSPYYYNELTRMHANSQFVPISNGNLRDENFVDFMNTFPHQ